MRKEEERIYGALISPSLREKLLYEMIGSAESENQARENNVCCVKHQSIKMEINCFTISSCSLLKGFFPACQWWFVKELNDYLNVWYVNFILFMLVFSLIRDGLKLSDISGASYSQWCKEKQLITFKFFIFYWVSIFPSERPEKQQEVRNSSHMYTALQQVTSDAVSVTAKTSGVTSKEMRHILATY